MILFKEGVRITRLTPALKRMLDVLDTLDGAFAWVPADLVVTSINDSEHAPASRHYLDEALDLRSHNFASGQDRERFRALAADRLGPRFTVLLEHMGQPNEHFHFQPVKGTVYP